MTDNYNVTDMYKNYSKYLKNIRPCSKRVRDVEKLEGKV